MATSEFVCGTGVWVGPKPGDPDNNIVLNATSTFGGIDVSWSYPATNPHAVAHVVVYRGLTDNFGGAVQRTIVSGNHFFDKFDGAEPVVYYYWIQLVSVNGTYASFVGPASATARPSIEETIRQLSGKIDQGALAQELRADIDHIGLLDNTITGEIQNRIAANQAISLALGSVQGEVATAITLIEEEVTERINANSALLTSLNLMGVGFNNAVAGLTEEIELIATDTSALATKITTVEATVNGNTATGQVGLTAKVNEITGAIQSMYTAKVGVNGLIGGFGLYNDGTSVEAGFDVDTFWVGKADKTIKPFIIENGEVFINKAAIQTLSANQIDTRGLSIRDMDGNIIFSAGNPLNYSQITPASGWLNSNLIPSIDAAATTANWSGVSGLNKPEDGATVGAPTGTYVGETLAETVAAKANDAVQANGDNILGGTTSVKTAYNAGIRVGDLQWNADGSIVSGKGVAITPGGIVGHDGTKTTFAVNASNGEAYFSGRVSGSSFVTGAYNAWAWPAAGQNGCYLGPEGLLLGNYNDSKYFQVTSVGNVFAPGMKIENGVLTISQANVINTLQLAGNSATVSDSTSGVGGVISTTILLKANTTLKVVLIVNFASLTVYGSYSGAFYAGYSLSIDGNSISHTVSRDSWNNDENYFDARTYMHSVTLYGGAVDRAVTVSAGSSSVGGAIEVQKVLAVFGMMR